MGKGFSRRNSRIYFWHSRAFRRRDSLIYEPVCWGRISPTKVGTDSPKALLGSRPKVPVCPTVPNPRVRMFLAAFSSRSKTQPHLQTWVLVDSVFLRISPQLEHSKAGVLWIHRNRDFLEYLDEVFKPDTELIPRCVVNRLGQTMVLHHVFDSQIFVTITSFDAHYAPCKFYCMVQCGCLLILRWRLPRICLARAPVFWTFYFPRYTTPRVFDDFFTFDQKSRIFNRSSVRVGVIFL